MPLVAPLRPLLNLTDGRGAITRAYQLMGGAPKPLVKWAFQLSSFQKLVTKPVALVTHLDDADFLAQIEAVDRFTDGMIAYPGRTFGQLYHRFVKGNAAQAPARWSWATGPSGSPTSRCPVLVFAGATDGIAPVAAVKAMVPLLTGSTEVRFEIVPGGHLGMLTGRAARGTTWRAMDEWISQWSTPEARYRRSRARPSRSQPRSQPRRPRQEAAAKKTADENAKGGEEGPRQEVRSPMTTPSGSTRRRRYGSAGSRSLAP